MLFCEAGTEDGLHNEVTTKPLLKSSPRPSFSYTEKRKTTASRGKESRKEVLPSSEPWPWGRRLPGWERDRQGARRKARRLPFCSALALVTLKQCTSPR